MAQTDAHSLADSKDAHKDIDHGSATHPGSAAMQEKAGIDAGLTGDKVAHNDIATSPLGTDDEAGGGAPQPVQAPKPEAAAHSQARDPNFANERSPRAAWIWIAVALLAAVVLGVALLGALSPD